MLIILDIARHRKIENICMQKSFNFSKITLDTSWHHTHAFDIPEREPHLSGIFFEKIESLERIRECQSCKEQG